MSHAKIMIRLYPGTAEEPYGSTTGAGESMSKLVTPGKSSKRAGRILAQTIAQHKVV
jgi:hypothetical protein